MKKLYVLFVMIIFAFASCSKQVGDIQPGSDIGKGGSLSRFTIVGNYLYAVDKSDIKIFDITTKETKLKGAVKIGFDIETIFPFDKYLFIGSASQMFVYEINQDGTVKEKGSVSHLRACDPVVANEKYAYVTVRSGSNCGGNVNELLVYNIEQLGNMQLIQSQSLKNPHGLGLYNDYLYVCNNDAGLVIFKIEESGRVNELSSITNKVFLDCIIYNELFIAYTQKGISIYSLNDPEQLVLLSTIEY